MSKDEDTKLFLNTGLSHIDVAKALVEDIQSSIEYLTYNIRRYKVPVTLVLFYSQEDISQSLEDSMRLTDVIHTIKLGDAYLSFVFLLFTEEVDCYSFVKHVEHTKLEDIKNFFYFEKLPHTVHNYYNFINSYLFEIEKKETFF
ncbi:hypothetical protein SMGD1_0356 [Sulfurimonas gotlandica GD1]|uniref:Uncharacterized protein n=1 Tax=Sulfurimonas gotlandica (strain DSM 19862 / JCM 16533 / GD1) TaxID=929558 RepID=B6BNS9_SULGG|nr:hypothetical protein [Sulfurimonas gotlandica]EDZ61184.1 hypothetical protein CBGD1_9 [Sulfurimonas gotlandica GD1]EHP28883.1 hypothetical protein SMGD1_0356 [Sulfurimonas gotlandica GD1]